jgi:hypothetical protein
MVKKSRLFVLVAGALALGACSDSATTAPKSLAATGPQFLTIAAGDFAAVPGPSTCGSPASYPLYSGGGGGGTGTLVGHVLVCSTPVSGGNTTITVTYSLTTGCLTETHLQVALTLAGVPTKNDNPIPGQFDLSHSDACTTTDTYVINNFHVGTDNAVIIAAHAVVASTVTLFAGGNFVSGSTLTGNVVNHRAGNVSGFTAVNTPLVAAWEPTNNTDPSYWDTVINADPSGNGAWLLTAGADWVWESFRVLHPIDGDVIQANLTLSVPVATTGTFRITCDNGYRVDLNGVTITNGGDGATAGLTTQLSTAFATNTGLATNTNLKQANVNAQGWQTVEAYAVNLLAGTNTFTLYGVNEYQNSDDTHPGFAGFGGIGIGTAGVDPVGTVDLNPAGCIFGLAANPVTGPGGEETAWGAPNGFTGATTGSNVTGGNFAGKNWATYFVYQVQ